MANERTVSGLLFRTFVLRIVVALTHAALLRLQGHHPRSTAFIQHLALYTILPFTALADYVVSIAQFLASLRWNRTKRTIQFAILQIAGARIRIDGETGGRTNDFISLRLCDSRKVIRSSKLAVRDVQKARLHHVGKILAACASFAFCLSVLVLVIRRMVLVLHSWLLVDFWNGLSALTGCVAAFMVLLLLLFGPMVEAWTYPPEAALRSEKHHAVTGLSIPMLCMLSYPFNALFFNYFHAFHKHLYPMLRSLLWATLLPIVSHHPEFEGYSPALFAILLFATVNLDRIRPTSLIWAYWLAFALMVFNDLWLIYGSTNEELKHAREGYPGETFHNWIWIDEMTPVLRVY